MTGLVSVLNSAPNYDKTVEFDTSATSTPVDLGGQTLIGIVTPAGLSGTTFTVHAPTGYTNGDPSTTYVALTDDTGTDVTITVSADDEHICFSSTLIAKLRGVRYLKLVSGSPETATITLVTAVI